VRRHGDIGSLARALASLLGERTFEIGRALAQTQRGVRYLDAESPTWLERYQ
jgi:hypothetical protein